MLMYVVLFAIFGMVMGSFLNVVGLRLPQGEPFANERSGCPICGHELKYYELIPVLSYVIQRGRCRGCQTSISLQYPLVELATGILYALIYLHIGMSWELVVGLLFVSMFVILFVSDLKYMIIPDNVLLFFAPLFIIGRFISPLDPWWSPLLGMVIGYGVIYLIIMLSNGGMGGGDMKLFAVIGYVLGWKLVILTLMISFIIGAVLGLGLMAVGIVKKGQPFPFGPSIMIAALISYIYGYELLQWYIGLI